MSKGNHKRTYTPEEASSKVLVLEDQFIGGLDNKYDDHVQKLFDWVRRRATSFTTK